MTEEKKVYKKAYYQAHKEELKEYRQAHKEELKEYRQAHKDEAKEYRQVHKDEAKEYMKAYRQVHKDEAKEYDKFHKRQHYCCEEISQIENYELAKADNFVDWDIHHRLETHSSDGERRLVDLTADELKVLDMYYNRPASELIFMTHSEHRSLHNMKGKKK